MKIFSKLKYLFFIFFIILGIEYLYFFTTFNKQNKEELKNPVTTTRPILSIINRVNIFADENNNYNEYGGNQMIFSYYADYLLEDNLINSIFDKYFPEYSYDQRKLLLDNLSDVGCGYVSAINTIFQHYSYDSKRFKEVFGFSMYNMAISADGELFKKFNYEYLILDLYLYTINNSDEEVGNYSMGILELKRCFPEWLKEEYGIEVTIGIMPNKDNISHNLKKERNKNNYIFLVSSDFNLYLVNDDETKGLRVNENIKTHAMTLVKVEGVNLIVSSWGKKYLISLPDDELSIENIAIINYQNL